MKRVWLAGGVALAMVGCSFGINEGTVGETGVVAPDDTGTTAIDSGQVTIDSTPATDSGDLDSTIDSGALVDSGDTGTLVDSGDTGAKPDGDTGTLPTDSGNVTLNAGFVGGGVGSTTSGGVTLRGAFVVSSPKVMTSGGVTLKGGFR